MRRYQTKSRIAFVTIGLAESDGSHILTSLEKPKVESLLLDGERIIDESILAERVRSELIV